MKAYNIKTFLIGALAMLASCVNKSSKTEEQNYSQNGVTRSSTSDNAPTSKDTVFQGEYYVYSPVLPNVSRFDDGVLLRGEQLFTLNFSTNNRVWVEEKLMDPTMIHVYQGTYVAKKYIDSVVVICSLLSYNSTGARDMFEEANWKTYEFPYLRKILFNSISFFNMNLQSGIYTEYEGSFSRATYSTGAIGNTIQVEVPDFEVNKSRNNKVDSFLDKFNEIISYDGAGHYLNDIANSKLNWLSGRSTVATNENNNSANTIDSAGSNMPLPVQVDKGAIILYDFTTYEEHAGHKLPKYHASVEIKDDFSKARLYVSSEVQGQIHHHSLGSFKSIKALRNGQYEFLVSPLYPTGGHFDKVVIVPTEYECKILVNGELSRVTLQRNYKGEAWALQ